MSIKKKLQQYMMKRMEGLSVFPRHGGQPVPASFRLTPPLNKSLHQPLLIDTFIPLAEAAPP